MRAPLSTALVGMLAVVTLASACASTATAYPPDPPGEAVSRQHLAALTVAAETSMAGYERETFPHWSDQPDTICDTGREEHPNEK